MHGKLRILPLIILSIVLLFGVYAYYGIINVIDLYTLNIQNTILVIFYGILGTAIFSILTIFILGNSFSKSIRNFFFAFVFIALISFLFFDLFLLIDDIRRFFYFLFESNDNNRSYALISIGLIIAIVPAFLFLLGMVLGPYRYKTKSTSIPLNNLPIEFDGLKIVQISDIHSGSFYNKKAVNKGVNMILDQKPDVIFFTGDLVNDDATEMDNYKDVFSRLKAPLGVYSILGNHDYGDYVQWPSKEAKEKNVEQVKNVHKEMGWRLLLNEHVYLRKGDQKIGLIGVENWGKGFHQVGDLEKAYKECEATVKLLLSHDPTHWDEQVIKDYTDIDITFSGHTHGAQMGFEIGKYKWSPIQLRYKKWAGLYAVKNQFLYINRGFGFLGYPGRLGIWPEISVITLKKNN